jgi:serine/threonine-protein kinase PRP4
VEFTYHFQHPCNIICTVFFRLLLQARRSKVKMCDLGSAMLAGENERTPYLVSRFYRSPEVILGLAYGESCCYCCYCCMISQQGCARVGTQ